MLLIYWTCNFSETKNRSIEDIVNDFRNRSRSLTMIFSVHPDPKAAINELNTLLEASDKEDSKRKAETKSFI